MTKGKKQSGKIVNSNVSLAYQRKTSPKSTNTARPSGRPTGGKGTVNRPY